MSTHLPRPKEPGVTRCGRRTAPTEMRPLPLDVSDDTEDVTCIRCLVSDGWHITRARAHATPVARAYRALQRALRDYREAALRGSDLDDAHNAVLAAVVNAKRLR